MSFLVASPSAKTTPSPSWRSRGRLLARRDGNRGSRLIARARGTLLWDSEGKEILDFTSGQMCATIGHNHPRIKAAIAHALESGTSFGTPNPYEIEMAELIVRFVPSIQKVRMCNSGTEATMSAIDGSSFTPPSIVLRTDL